MKKGIVISICFLLILVSWIPTISSDTTENTGQSTLTFYPTDDVHIDNYSTNINGYHDHLVVRNAYGAGGSAVYEWNTFIKFNISSLIMGTSISSATLNLFYYDWLDNNPVGRNLNIYRVTSNWNEDNITGSSEPSYASVPTTYTTMPSSYDWISWDVTSDVQDIVDGTVTDYGWKIMDENYWGASNIPEMFFRSKEYGTYIPYLEIETIPTADVYVDDDADPSWYDATHVKTVQEGIDNASSGDTVFVYNGTYYEHITINKQLYLIGEDKNTTIIDGSNSGHIVDVSASGVTIINFTIRNAGTSTYIASIHLTSDNNHIFNNNIIDSQLNMYLHGSSGNVISYNYFYDSIGSSECLRFQSGSSNNWFHNNTLNHCGIRTLYNCDYNIWENNTFVNSGNNGLNPDGHYNVFRYNHLDNSSFSTSQRSHYNEIYGNNFVNGSQYSIVDYQASHDNIVYHNNFIDSTAIIKFSGNYMYNPTLQEGNYWSDFDESIEGAWDNDSNGIADNPYTVPGDAGAQDLYPLMNPYNFVPSESYYIGLCERPNGNGCTGLIKTLYDGIVLTIKSYDENTILLELPKYADTWTELYNDASVDYNHPEGIYFTSSSPVLYRAINATQIFENDYTIDMKIQYTNRWHMLGCIFNYIDENNYQMASLHYDRDEYKFIIFTSIIDGVTSQEELFYPTTGNTDYDFKVKVSNSDGLVFIYVNGALEWTVNITSQSSEPSTIYVDDDYTSSTPGWQYDHFDVIQDGIDAVAEGGTVFVYNGTYYENVIVDKTIDLIGDDINNTKIIYNNSKSDSAVNLWNINTLFESFTVIGGGHGVDINNDYITVSNITIKNCSDAALEINGNNNIIKNCIILGDKSNPNGHGIEIQNGVGTAQNNLVKDNKIQNSYNGIVIENIGNCINNHLKNNYILNCTDKGIYIISSNNFIENNTVEQSHYGIQIRFSENNIVKNNLLFGNVNALVLVDDTYNNLIYHNNLINNTRHAYDEHDNLWDNGYPIGGNYYDDYTGTDQDGDGIGDTPYNITGGGNQDLYPFIEEDGWLKTIDVDQEVFGRGFPIRHAVDGDWAGAQNFKTTEESLTRVDVYLRKFGTPEFNLTLEVRENSPDGILIESFEFEPDVLDVNWGWLNLDLEDIITTPGTDYFIVCPPAPSGVTTSFGYEWGYAFGNQYDDGAFWFTRDGGGLWRDLPTMYEFVFRTFGYTN